MFVTGLKRVTAAAASSVVATRLPNNNRGPTEEKSTKNKFSRLRSINIPWHTANFPLACASSPGTNMTMTEAGLGFREYAMHGSTERMMTYASMADVHEAEGNSKRTALHKAAFWGHLETMSVLLDKYKLDPNAQDHDGDTALHDAVRFGHADVVDKLLYCGADKDIKNKAGQDACDVAREYNQQAVLVRLLNKMLVKVGSIIPDVDDTFVDSPALKDKVKIADLFKGKKGILFAVPGAFTPGCSKKHLPSYVNNADALKKAGADVIVCISCVDPFVMAAWGKAHGTEGKIIMVADPRANFTKALGFEMDASATLGSMRSQRYSMVVQDGVIKSINVDAKGIENTLAGPTMLKF